MQSLTIDQIIEVVKLTPEQACFDWKRDFAVPNDDEKRGEFLKDLSAIANACPPDRYGFIIYGVDPRQPELVCGTSQSYDDAKLQQLVQGKIEPVPEFLYYELMFGARRVDAAPASFASADALASDRPLSFAASLKLILMATST